MRKLRLSFSFARITHGIMKGDEVIMKKFLELLGAFIFGWLTLWLTSLYKVYGDQKKELEELKSSKEKA